MNKNNEPPFMPSENEWNEMRSMIMETHGSVLKILREQEKELLTATEVCKILKISRDTYQEYAKSKLFQQIQLVANGRMYVQRSEIERLIERGKV